MNKTYARRTIKAGAMQNMRGNWIGVFILFLISLLLMSFISGLLPITIPSVEDAEFQNNRMNEILERGVTEENVDAAYAEMQEVLYDTFKLFFPKGITKRVIASFLVTGLLYLVAMCPFNIGMRKYYMRAADSEKGSVIEVFSSYKNLYRVFGAVLLNVIIFVVSAFWWAVFAIIPLAFNLVAMLSGSVILILVSPIVALLTVIFSILWTSRYRFALYIFAEGNKGVFASFIMCLKILRGNNIECMLLRASYFGWDIICAIFPIMGIVYNSLSGVVYARYLIYFRGIYIDNERIKREAKEKND